MTKRRYLLIPICLLIIFTITLALSQNASSKNPDKFSDWLKEKIGKRVRVNYSDFGILIEVHTDYLTLDNNGDIYVMPINKIKLVHWGDTTHMSLNIEY